MVAAPLIAAVTTSVSTIAIVGATISAVGALSGSKDLAKIGGLIGLAGGVMSMAGAGTGAVSGESLVGAEEFEIGIVFDQVGHVLKNRHGAEGIAKAWFHAPAGAVRDREHQHG